MQVVAAMVHMHMATKKQNAELSAPHASQDDTWAA